MISNSLRSPSPSPHHPPFTNSPAFKSRLACSRVASSSILALCLSPLSPLRSTRSIHLLLCCLLLPYLCPQLPSSCRSNRIRNASCCSISFPSTSSTHSSSAPAGTRSITDWVKCHGSSSPCSKNH